MSVSDTNKMVQVNNLLCTHELLPTKGQKRNLELHNLKKSKKKPVLCHHGV